MTATAKRRERALKIWETRRRLYGPTGLPSDLREARRAVRREGALSGWSIRKRREAREGPASAEQLKGQGVAIFAEHRAKRIETEEAKLSPEAALAVELIRAAASFDLARLPQLRAALARSDPGRA